MNYPDLSNLTSVDQLREFVQKNNDCFPVGFEIMLKDEDLNKIIENYFSIGVRLKQIRNAGYSPITGIFSILITVDDPSLKREDSGESGILILCDRTRKLRAVIDEFEVAPIISDDDTVDTIPLTIENLFEGPPTIDKKAREIYQKKLEAFWDRIGMPNGSELGEANSSTYECTGGVPTGYPTGCAPDTKVDKDCQPDEDYVSIF